MTARPIALAVLVALGAGCVSGGAEVAEPVPTLFDDEVVPSTSAPADETTSSTASTTTIPVVDRLPALAEDVPGAIVSDDGVVLPVTGTDGEVFFLLGPCGGEQIEPVSTATRVGPQHVVLDPGGGDDEAGRVNLAVARRTAEELAADGVAVVLTRTSDAQLGAGTRGAVGPAVGAAVLVSIQRGDGYAVTDDPRPTVFHRADDPESRRLAGLIHHEVELSFADLDGPFTAHAEPGVRPLLNQRGEDFFRVLQTSPGVAAARVELLGLDENETALLSSEEGREFEARALADAIVRFLVTNEEGDGFVDPVETMRTAPTTDAPGGC
ncbi:MAG: N-acetylmuramoyl-L-alanine amidase [Acidimicrobiales bacterium]